MSSTSWATPDKEALYGLINQRLHLMTDVAHYKYANGLPIEDLLREQKVLASARHNAVLAGLDQHSVEDFFVAQITAAKNIQRQYQQVLAEQPAPKIGPRDLNTDIRPQLIRLGNDTVHSLAQLLATGLMLSAQDWPFFRQTIDAPYLTEVDRKRLFDGLLKVQLLAYPPRGFVDVQSVIPDIAIDLRYLGNNNFVGRPIDGYLNRRLLLSQEAATALKAVQDELQEFALGLKVFDGYRPQQAVDHFVRWAEDLDDQEMKSIFYPTVDKGHLFRDEYIAARSSHTRGSTVDLTIISLTPGEQVQALDMGSPFDFFSPLSWPMEQSITAAQRAHRLLLGTLMQKYGFTPYPKEWWHFTLQNEPYPDTYFNFPIQ